MMTPEEHNLVEKLGSLMEDFNEISGPKRANDMFEVMLHVHALQNMVLAQSAARAYPGTYRLLGESLRFDGIPDGPSVEAEPHAVLCYVSNVPHDHGAGCHSNCPTCGGRSRE
jgi:hypothetical protein